MIALTASPSEISRTAPSVDAPAAPPAVATRNVRRLGARALALTSKSSARIALTSRAPAALVLSLLARATAARRRLRRAARRPPGVTLTTGPLRLWLTSFAYVPALVLAYQHYLLCKSEPKKHLGKQAELAVRHTRLASFLPKRAFAADGSQPGASRDSLSRPGAAPIEASMHA